MSNLEQQKSFYKKENNKENKVNDSTPIIKVNDSVNDYESVNIITNEREIISISLVNLIFGIDNKITITNKDGSVNSHITNIINESFKSSNFIENFKLAFIDAFLNGKGVLRIAGDIFNPICYVVKSFVGTWDRADERKIKKLYTTFAINSGTEQGSIVIESYNFMKGILYSQLNNFTKQTKIDNAKKVPYILIIPNKDKSTLQQSSVFNSAREREEFYNANWNKAMIYAKYVNYHLLPDKGTLIEWDAETPWFKKALSLFWMRKNNVSKGSNQTEAVEVVEPNIDYYVKIISALKESGGMLYDSVGLQSPTFEGTKQMSEHEIAVLKQKEKLTILNYQKYLYKLFKHILSFYLDFEFEMSIEPFAEITKNQIDEKELDFKKEQANKPQPTQSTSTQPQSQKVNDSSNQEVNQETKETNNDN